MSGPRFSMTRPTPPTPATDAFVIVPQSVLPQVSPEHAAWQKELYAWALAEAQAVVRPSILERDLLGVWN